MIDYLFIGPLGWKKSVWNKLLQQISCSNYDFVEFYDFSENNSNFKKLEEDVLSKINLLKKTGTIIAASYGSRFLMNILRKVQLTCEKIIIIDGFQEIPDIDTIKVQIENRQELFSNIEQYLDYMLDSNEKKDTFILDSVIDTIKKDDRYVVCCDNNTMIRYLSFLSNIKNDKLIHNLANQSCKKYVFSAENLTNINYYPINESDHLLMLSKPEKIIELL